MTGKHIFILKDYCKPAHTAALKLFMLARLRFVNKKMESAAQDKKLVKVSEFMHIQAAAIDDYTTKMNTFLEATAIANIKHFLDNFAKLFKP